MQLPDREVTDTKEKAKLISRSTGLARGIAATVATLAMAGCGVVGYTINSTPVSPGSSTLTGNWEIAVTTTSGSSPFSALSGSILQEAPPASGPSPVVAELQAIAPTSCYLGLATVPLQGNVSTTSLSLLSLSVAGQYLTLTGGNGTTADNLTGTFSISGGCSDGVKGKLAGTKIAAMSGTYAGAWNASSSSGRTISLTLAQDSFSDGLGYFHVGGSAAFSGVSCFTGGTVQAIESTITGQHVLLTIASNETGGSTVTLAGTLDPAGRTLTLTSIQVVSGNCPSSAGTATLTS